MFLKAAINKLNKLNSYLKGLNNNILNFTYVAYFTSWFKKR